jgi:hypothetical protein
MTTADCADPTRNREVPDRSGPPLLHLRGTPYGLVIHGLRMAADGPQEPRQVPDVVQPVDGGLSL